MLDVADAERTAHAAAQTVKQEGLKAKDAVKQHGQDAKSVVRQAGEALEEGFVTAVQAPRHMAETVRRQVPFCFFFAAMLLCCVSSILLFASGSYCPNCNLGTVSGNACVVLQSSART